MAPGKEVVSNRVVLFNFFKGHGQIKRSPIIVLNYNLIDYLNNSNLFNSYNPGQKVLGHLPFFMEFAAYLQYTLTNTALTRFFPHPPWTKLRSLTVARYVKGVWFATPNTVQGVGEGVELEIHFPHLKQNVPNRQICFTVCKWTKILKLQILRIWSYGKKFEGMNSLLIKHGRIQLQRRIQLSNAQ